MINIYIKTEIKRYRKDIKIGKKVVVVIIE